MVSPQVHNGLISRMLICPDAMEAETTHDENVFAEVLVSNGAETEEYK